MFTSQLSFIDTFIEELEPIENESDLEELLLTDLNDAIVQATDWTTDTILSQIEKGRILLNPNFQRRDAWTDDRKSRFIESILLGFPIPQLVLAESQQRGKYIVIDGKQRLLSLVQFAGTGESPEGFKTLRLKGLEILNRLNGKTKEEIHSTGLGAQGFDEFENRTIRTVVIRHWKNEAVLYHIFLRLNTGSVQLSPQELRNALHPGLFAEFVDTYSADSPAMHKILQIKRPDFRMRDAELFLRYYAFRNFLSYYSGSMKQILDLTTERLNEEWVKLEEELRDQARQFEDAVNLTYTVFGPDDAFRKWKDGRFAGRFNRAVYDVMLFHFWKPEVRREVQNRTDDIKSAFIKLSETHPEFIDALESTTKSLTATTTRLALWTQALTEVTNLDLVVPRLVKNRIIIDD